MPTAAAQVASDPEKLLAERFGFTAAEIAQARSGKSVAKLLPTQDSSDVGVLGAVRIDGTPARLAGWLQDVANFRKAAELGLARRISEPPKIGDFAELALDADELAALRDCAPGKCDMRLGDHAIKQFQAIDWKAADAGRRANLLARQLLLGYAEAYLKGGDAALGTYHNDSKPKAAADEFRLVVAQATTMKQLAAPLVSYLTGFPGGDAPTIGGVDLLGEGRRRSRCGDLAPPACRLARSRRRGACRRQAVVLQPLHGSGADRDLAGADAGRQGLLRACRCPGPVESAQRHGGPDVARSGRKSRPRDSLYVSRLDSRQPVVRR